MIHAGLIGFGYWGTKLARNLGSIPGVSLAAIADVSRERLMVAAELHPRVALFDSGEALLNADSIEAVIIATPVIRHYPLCKLALERGKHVLVEKPMTASQREATELVELALVRGLSLTVDHTYIYSPAIRRIKEMVRADTLGSFEYFDSVRANFGVFRQDINVIWDLAAHDFSIVDHLFPSRALRVSANAARLSRRQECIAYITVYFDDGCEGHFSVNWLAPEKTRKIVVCGSKIILAYDDVQPLDKLRIYENPCIKNEDFANCIPAHCSFVNRPAQIVALDPCEPLKNLLCEFADAVRVGTKTASDGDAGVRVVRMLAAAEKSARAGGLPLLI